MQIQINNTDSAAPSHLLTEDQCCKLVLKAGTDLEGVHCLVPVFCHSEFSWTEYPIASTISYLKVESKKVQIFIHIILMIFRRLHSTEVLYERKSQKAVFLN
jgi:hypothetical protein